jgi:cyclopropane fatty-acyl-phospholipid synthase-like methyltransferase
VEYLGPESFDAVISTELLEHVKDWRIVINNMKQVLKLGGYITTRSKGFPHHAYPYDYWRYELSDMKAIFSDFEIVCLRKDHMDPGVFLKARKPLNWASTNLDNTALYSIILGKRTKEIPSIEDAPLSRRLMFRFLNSKARYLVPGTLIYILMKRYI